VKTRTGGAILIDALKVNGAGLVYCVPGESYLEALDAFYDAQSELRLIVCRQEGGAAYMAEAFGKLTGRPGICFVTRGPGATNAAIGVHTARQDSTPMILFIGQVDRGMRDREAFQEIDVAAMFGSLAKWAAQIDDPHRIPEYVARAFYVATSGRAGPVVLGLPEDMLTAEASVADVAAGPPAQPNPGSGALTRMRDLLAEAHRPVAILGGSGWTGQARSDVSAFLEKGGIPTSCAFRRQDLFDNRSPCYVGYTGIGIAPSLAQRIRDADVILAVGTRLSEAVTQGYTLLESPRPKQRLIHVHPDPDELGRVYQADVPINAAMPEFGAALRAIAPLDGTRWKKWLEDAHCDYEETLKPETPARSGFVDLAPVVKYLDATLSDDAILTSGAGNFAGWLHRYYRYRDFPTQLGAVNGSMGYGLPSAIAAKLAHPQRLVVAFCGDGDFLMTGQELATAVQYDAPVVVILANNGMYGTIRMHQEREHPERVIGTELLNPDFVGLAQAYGAHGEVVTTSDAFAGAFERAIASGKPAILELKVDPELISTRATIGSLRKRHRKPK